MAERKPWLDAAGQVERLRSRGARFKFISGPDAVAYLKRNGNYFRLRSHGTGCCKVEEGPREGQHANLDLKMPVDLSIIDALMRYEMLPMTLNTERFEKVGLLGAIEGAGEDGRAVVSDFLATCDMTHDGKTSNRTRAEISRGQSSPCAEVLLERCPELGFPAWALIEAVSFGAFVHLYRFYAEKFNGKAMSDGFYLLQSVRGLGSACAQGRCIINDMSSCDSGSRGNQRHGGRPAKGQTQQREAPADCDDALRAREGRVPRRWEPWGRSLGEPARRMSEHIECCRGDDQIISSFAFLTTLIGGWFPVGEE